MAGAEEELRNQGRYQPGVLAAAEEVYKRKGQRWEPVAVAEAEQRNQGWDQSSELAAGEVHSPRTGQRGEPVAVVAAAQRNKGWDQSSELAEACLSSTSPSPLDQRGARMPCSA